MKRIFSFVAILALCTVSRAAEAPLEQVRAIPLDVEGRIDHMSLTPDGRRLFVAALGNNSVEILDTENGGRAVAIPNIKQPQGVFYIPDSKKLAVASGGEGNLRIYDQTPKLVATVDNLDDADNVRYEPQTEVLYLGYGSGALAVIDPEKGVKLAEITLDGHPESFQLESRGQRIFVNVPAAHHIAVVDRDQRSVIARWPLKDAKANFPMALDEAHQRLFVGCRQPGRLVIFDTQSGHEVAGLDSCGDMDDLCYDPARGRIYASGGEGCISIFEQTDGDHYRLIETVKTAAGARTCLFDSARGLLYLAVPHRGKQRGEIRIYKCPSSAVKLHPGKE